MNTISFYSAREKTYGVFSNFSPHGIIMKDKYWRTVEHYFQAQKFADTSHEEAIRGAHTPKQAANMGRDRSRPLRKDWEAVKDGIMQEAVLKKFQTQDELREILLYTEENRIVENAPGDYYWGCGADGTGLNSLGEILMSVREQIRKTD